MASARPRLAAAVFLSLGVVLRTAIAEGEASCKAGEDSLLPEEREAGRCRRPTSALLQVAAAGRHGQQPGYADATSQQQTEAGPLAEAILRNQDAPVYEPLAQAMRRAVSQLATHFEYDLNYPVVATALDSEYKEFLPKWASRLEQLGLRQQIIVALDEETARTAAQDSLPAVTGSGDPLFSLEPGPGLLQVGRGTQQAPPDHTPADFTTIKFLLPLVLLQAGVELVIFSEADIYLFGNPVPQIEEARRQSGACYLAISNGVDESYGRTNIGFIAFAGKPALGPLDAFLRHWWPKRDETRVVADQIEWSNVLSGFPDVAQAFLPEMYFAVRPRNVTPSSIMVHMAWSPPDCKQLLLRELYERESLSPSGFAKAFERSGCDG